MRIALFKAILNILCAWRNLYNLWDEKIDSIPPLCNRYDCWEFSGIIVE
jgi:hypothetical protein